MLCMYYKYLWILCSSWTVTSSWTVLCQILWVQWASGCSRLKKFSKRSRFPNRAMSRPLTPSTRHCSGTRYRKSSKGNEQWSVKVWGGKSREVRKAGCKSDTVFSQDILRLLETHQQTFQRLHRDGSVSGVSVPAEQLQDMAERCKRERQPNLSLKKSRSCQGWLNKAITIAHNAQY